MKIYIVIRESFNIYESTDIGYIKAFCTRKGAQDLIDKLACECTKISEIYKKLGIFANEKYQEFLKSELGSETKINNPYTEECKRWRKCYNEVVIENEDYKELISLPYLSDYIDKDQINHPADSKIPAIDQNLIYSSFEIKETELELPTEHIYIDENRGQIMLSNNHILEGGK